MPRIGWIAGICAALAGAILPFAEPLGAQNDGAWPPIDPADLKLVDYVNFPGAPAVILDYWDDTNNPQTNETVRVRTKVLRAEGMKYGQVEIPYFEKYMQVEEIQARTVAPDGTITPFSGMPIDKEIVKARGYKLNEKVLTLPNVQVGTIIDYAFRLHWKKGFPDAIKNPGRYAFDEPVSYPAADWEVQRDIPVRRAHLSLKAYPHIAFRFMFVGFPKEPDVDQARVGEIHVELKDIPSFVNEEASPPEENLRSHIKVFYAFGFWDPEVFWSGLGRRDGKAYDEFFKKSKRANEEVRNLLATGDTDEQKLRKIYARAQQIRMVSFEESRTEKEIKRADLKDNKSVDDVLNHNYAYNNEINLVFVAMARAAGFRASPVRVKSRETGFFEKNRVEVDQLNAMVVAVTLNGKTRFFDPATLYCPYDLLPWAETDTMGVLANSENARLIQVDALPSSDAITQRTANLKLDTEGNLEGEVRVSFQGQEALSRRLDARNQDEAQRKKELEDWLKASLPASSMISLASYEGIDKAEGPFTAIFHVRTSDYAATAGQRVLLPISYFGGSASSSFYTSAHRVHPVYFRHAAEYHDSLDIAVPEQLAIESTPSTELINHGSMEFNISVQRKAQTVHITQDFVLRGDYFPISMFPQLRDFYQRAAAAREAQITLKKTTAGTAAVN